ncbi:hypothetical protein [Caulobacter radicis]|uniref:hypothetical protein n=1 Tax=Caulobacter radicis TaxID=2172650 RepID=UPI001401DF18|nr:hypothetical protein [Caulobacter radicis]
MTNAEYEAHLKRIDRILARSHGRLPLSNTWLTMLLIASPLVGASIFAAGMLVGRALF